MLEKVQEDVRASVGWASVVAEEDGEAGPSSSGPAEPPSEDTVNEIAMLQESAATAKADGQLKEAVCCMEDAFVLSIQAYGQGTDPVFRACRDLIQGYNMLAMKLVEEELFDEAYELLKKAEVLTEPDGCLAGQQGKRLKLAAITMNNLGCFFKRKGKLQASLHYLNKALSTEMQAPDPENPAGTLLNLCATLSQLDRHAQALVHAQRAVDILVWEREEKQMGEGVSTAEGAANLSIQAIAFHNQAVEQEYLHQWGPSKRSYLHACRLAQQCWGPHSPMTQALKNNLAAFNSKLKEKGITVGSGNSVRQWSGGVRPASARVEYRGAGGGTDRRRPTSAAAGPSANGRAAAAAAAAAGGEAGDRSSRRPWSAGATSLHQRPTSRDTPQPAPSVPAPNSASQATRVYAPGRVPACLAPPSTSRSAAAYVAPPPASSVYSSAPSSAKQKLRPRSATARSEASTTRAGGAASAAARRPHSAYGPGSSGRIRPSRSSAARPSSAPTNKPAWQGGAQSYGGGSRGGRGGGGRQPAVVEEAPWGEDEEAEEELLGLIDEELDAEAEAAAAAMAALQA